MYTGLAMNPEDEAWAYAHGIPLTVGNLATMCVHSRVNKLLIEYVRDNRDW